MQKRFLFFSGISGALAVALGAMAAHFLRKKMEIGMMTELNLQTFETAARYQMYHSIAILVLALNSQTFNLRLLHKAVYCFMAGIVLFSGSLYLISTASLLRFSSISWLGPVTPIGGVFFISGWLFVAVAGIKSRKNKID